MGSYSSQFLSAVAFSSAGKIKPKPVMKAFDKELTDTSKKALSEFRRYKAGVHFGKIPKGGQKHVRRHLGGGGGGACV